MSEYLPKWHRELDIFNKIKPIIILEGNVLDSYQYPVEGSVPKGSILRLEQYLHYYFKDSGYQDIVFYDAIRGFYNSCEDGYLQSFARLVNATVTDQHIHADFKGRNGTAATIVRNAITQNAEATVVVMNFASRYITSPTNMDQSEIDSYTVLLQASMEAKDVRTPGGNLKNLVVIIANKVNDIPAWFYLDNPNVKNIMLQTPSKEEREQLVKSVRFPNFFANDIYAKENPYYQEHPDELEKIQDKFVGMTEGFSFTELNGLRRLAKNQRIHIRNLCDVVDLYKFGIKENPWNTIDREEIKNAHQDFTRRVKGQEAAITKTLDVIKRAMTGMSGLQSSSTSRPKGVLFFAGPTGTGKTETAKTLAEKLFGDERNCIRFDMSEYGQPHSDQKLLGAPPGYVGYEAGGQLTNAVKNNPFSILLFDEIEKAHPSILDKFLQILEDGRMTDGQGNTVYFSETIIFFTSNIGFSREVYDAQGNVVDRVQLIDPGTPYDEMLAQVRAAMETRFKPEFMGRIGDNVVLFDYIDGAPAQAILSKQVRQVNTRVESLHGVRVEVGQDCWDLLFARALEPGYREKGGRGIGNLVEDVYLNALSNFLFDLRGRDGAHVVAHAAGSGVRFEVVGA
jgi:ATP-dependent Clp protease ATP-binding subunit ClpA